MIKINVSIYTVLAAYYLLLYVDNFFGVVFNAVNTVNGLFNFSAFSVATMSFGVGAEAGLSIFM